MMYFCSSQNTCFTRSSQVCFFSQSTCLLICSFQFISLLVALALSWHLLWYLLRKVSIAPSRMLNVVVIYQLKLVLSMLRSLQMITSKTWKPLNIWILMTHTGCLVTTCPYSSNHPRATRSKASKVIYTVMESFLMTIELKLLTMKALMISRYQTRMLRM